LGLLNGGPEAILFFLALRAARASPRNAKRFVVLLQVLPQPGLSKDHLKDAYLAVEEICAGFLPPFVLIAANVGNCDVSQQNLTEESAKNLYRAGVALRGAWLDISAVLLEPESRR
jgi:hypothetical protein